jgi:hypothetical protein
MYPRSANTIFVPRVADQFDVLTALGQEQRAQRGRIRPEYVRCVFFSFPSSHLFILSSSHLPIFLPSFLVLLPANLSLVIRYATAVFIAYIQNKIAKGRTKFEIGLKLQDLERGVRPLPFPNPSLILSCDPVTTPRRLIPSRTRPMRNPTLSALPTNHQQLLQRSSSPRIIPITTRAPPYTISIPPFTLLLPFDDGCESGNAESVNCYDACPRSSDDDDYGETK